MHKDCRRDYINPKSTRWISCNDASTSIGLDTGDRDLRSNTDRFRFNENCLFCGQTAKNFKRKRGYDVVTVRTMDFQFAVTLVCKERNDQWGREVLGRIQMAHADLHAADALYHAQCNSNFRTGKQKPQTITSTPESNLKRRKMTPVAGRPKNEKAEAIFLEMMTKIEKNRKQIPIKDLVREMEHLCGVEDAYSIVHMKRKIREYFGNAIVFTEEDGKPSVLTFNSNMSSILHDFYQRTGKDNKDEEKRSIIQTAAKLIKDDILSVPSKVDHYK